MRATRGEGSVKVMYSSMLRSTTDCDSGKISQMRTRAWITYHGIFKISTNPSSKEGGTNVLR